MRSLDDSMCCKTVVRYVGRWFSFFLCFVYVCGEGARGLRQCGQWASFVVVFLSLFSLLLLAFLGSVKYTGSGVPGGTLLYSLLHGSSTVQQ